MNNFAPTVAAIHIVSSSPISTTTATQVLGHFEKIPLRYTVNVDYVYPSQSVVRVEAYNPDTRTWNELWTIDPHAYDFNPISGIDSRVNLVQELIDALFESVAAIL